MIKGIHNIYSTWFGGTDVSMEKLGEEVKPLPKPRTPEFKGTETTSWSSVDKTFGAFVSAYYDRTNTEKPDTLPDSFGNCPEKMRRWISNHSLLGNPESKTFDTAIVLPVVNPATGKLNKHAVVSANAYAGKVKGISEETLKKTKKYLTKMYNKYFAEDATNEDFEIQRGPTLNLGLESLLLKDTDTDDVEISEEGFWSNWWDSFKAMFKPRPTKEKTKRTIYIPEHQELMDKYHKQLKDVNIDSERFVTVTTAKDYLKAIKDQTDFFKYAIQILEKAKELSKSNKQDYELEKELESFCDKVTAIVAKAPEIQTDRITIKESGLISDIDKIMAADKKFIAGWLGVYKALDKAFHDMPENAHDIYSDDAFKAVRWISDLRPAKIIDTIRESYEEIIRATPGLKLSNESLEVSEEGLDATAVMTVKMNSEFIDELGKKIASVPSTYREGTAASDSKKVSIVEWDKFIEYCKLHTGLINSFLSGVSVDNPKIDPKLYEGLLKKLEEAKVATTVDGNIQGYKHPMEKNTFMTESEWKSGKLKTAYTAFKALADPASKMDWEGKLVPYLDLKPDESLSDEEKQKFLKGQKVLKGYAELFLKDYKILYKTLKLVAEQYLEIEA